MTIPALLLGFVLSTFYGTVFHLLVGGHFGRLIFYLILGWIGFWGGHFLAGQLALSFATLGTLHLGPASLGSLLVLVGGYWLSLLPKNLSA